MVVKLEINFRGPALPKRSCQKTHRYSVRRLGKQIKQNFGGRSGNLKTHETRMDTVLNHIHPLPNRRSILCKIQFNVIFPQFFRYSSRIFSTQRYGSQSQRFKSSGMLLRVDWWINTIILNTCQSTRRNVPKYLDFHQHLRQKFKFLIVLNSQLYT